MLVQEYENVLLRVCAWHLIWIIRSIKSASAARGTWYELRCAGIY